MERPFLSRAFVRMYSSDLRLSAVHALANIGGGVRRVAKVFGVAPSTLCRWSQLHRQRGAPAEAVNLSRSIRSLKDVARQIERGILHVSPEKLDSARQNIDKITTTLREGDNDRSQKPPTQGENERLPGKIYDSVPQHQTEFNWLLRADGEFNRYAQNITPLKTSAEIRYFLSAFITQLEKIKKHFIRYEAARLLFHMESVELKQAISDVMTYDKSFKQSFQGFHAKWVDYPQTAENYMRLLSVLEDVETSLRSLQLHGLIDMANRIRTSIGVILEEGRFWTGNNNEW